MHFMGVALGDLSQISVYTPNVFIAPGMVQEEYRHSKSVGCKTISHFLETLYDLLRALPVVEVDLYNPPAAEGLPQFVEVVPGVFVRTVQPKALRIMAGVEV